MPGVIAHFRELDAAVEAIEAIRHDKRFDEISVYSPTPRHELEHALHHGPSVVRKFTLFGGLAGVTFGYWIAIWCSKYWPLVVGGKAIASWVPYTIFGFEVMVLVGALSTVFGMIAVAGMPRLSMTIGYSPRFSGSDYGIWVESSGESARAAEDLLRRHGASEVRYER